MAKLQEPLTISHFTDAFILPTRIPLSAWLEHIPFAMYLVAKIKPHLLVELGSHYGASYCAFCEAALASQLDAHFFAIDTWQGDEQAGFYGDEVFQTLLAYNEKRYGAFSTLIKKTFEESLDYFADRSIDLLHIDGYHTYEETKKNFMDWLPKMSQQGIILFHDTNVRRDDFGVWKLWAELVQTYPYFEFKHGHGLGILAVGDAPPQELAYLFTLPLEEAANLRHFFAYMGKRWLTEYEKETALAERDHLKQLRGALESQLQQALQERDSQLQQHYQALQERDLLLEQHQHRLNEQDLLLQQQLKTLTEADARLQEIAADHQMQQAQSAQRLHEHGLQLQGLQSLLHERELQLQELTQAHNFLQAQQVSQLQGHQRALAASQTQLQAMTQAHDLLQAQQSAQLEVHQRALAASQTQLQAITQAHDLLQAQQAAQLEAHQQALAASQTQLQAITQAHDFLQAQQAAQLEALQRSLAISEAAQHTLQQQYAQAQSDYALQIHQLRGYRDRFLNSNWLLRRGFRQLNLETSRLFRLTHKAINFFRIKKYHWYIKRGKLAVPQLFDPQWYHAEYPDVQHHKWHPYVHFWLFGWFQGYKPMPLFDVDWYISNYPHFIITHACPLTHYEQEGQYLGYRPCEYLDPRWYRDHYPDIKSHGADPLYHYLHTGWQEWRDPSPEFDTQFYLTTYPDVAQMQVNPLVHYLTTGRKEGRLARPPQLPLVPVQQSAPLPSAALHVIANQANRPVVYQANQPADLQQAPVKLLAFYLPQFHPTAVNDQFWGKGFTEWTNVTKARPLFQDHYQPRLPGDLGFYDLRLVENLKAQTELARQHHLAGFAIYRYWFNGKTVLDQPLELLYANKDIEIEYCLAWANENWTRRWDGLDHEILLAQEHSPEDDLLFIADATRFFADPRYIRVANKPVLIVYNIQKIPDPQATAQRWRTYMQQQGYAGIYLIAIGSFGLWQNPRNFGFDALLSFPPHNVGLNDISQEYHFFAEFNGKVVDYDQIMDEYTHNTPQDYPVLHTVIPSWDNSARRGSNALIVTNSSPQKYQKRLMWAIQETIQYQPPDERLVFINGWNEWAESAYLEPDRQYGYAYLNATSQALASFSEPAQGTLVFLGHDAARAGAEIILKSLIAWFIKHSDLEIKVILGQGGELLAEFQALAPTFVISDWQRQGANADQIRQEIKHFVGNNVKLTYANTCVVGGLLDYLPYQAPILSHIHELADSVQRYCSDTLQPLLDKSAHFIAVSEPVKDLLHKTYHIPMTKLSLIYEFVEEQTVISAKSKFEIFGDEQTQIVWGCGTVERRKGFDLFIEVGKAVARVKPNVRFVWIGDPKPDFIDPAAYIRSQAAQETVLYLGVKESPREFFAMGDIFALTSREDPYPLVALEAADCTLPIVCFAETGGIPDFVSDEAGVVVPYLDTQAMVTAILALLNDTALRVTLGQRAREKYQQQHTASATIPRIYDLVQSLTAPKPQVSIIVPAYNHAPYLQRRLESIYQQTFQDFEVILLDDASPDGSAAILQAYANRYPQKTRLCLNNTNSGSTFAQWIKGLEQAQAELIWIAEDDDFSDIQFLEKMLPYFSDPHIKLAFSQSYAVDDQGEILFNYEVYTQELSPTRWQAAYIADGIEEVTLALAKKNTIPNASAVLFRKFDYTAWAADWKDAKLTGDWAFYLYAIQNGKIAFHPEPLNYHRRHDNTNIKRYAVHERRFIESMKVQKAILELYSVPPQTRLLMRQGSLDNWMEIYPERPAAEFEQVYSSFLAGQGETRPSNGKSAAHTGPANTLYDRYKNISDDEWHTLLLRSIYQQTIDGLAFPTFPSEELQKQLCGRANEAALEHAFRFYQQVRGFLTQAGIKLSPESVICDFACGWGRITRYFLKDVPSHHVIGLDSTEHFIQLCQATFPVGHFSTVPYEPPYLNIASQSYDVITSYSLFSHLNIPVANKIIQDFHRILRPRGILVITTRGKTFMDWCEYLRRSPDANSSYEQQLKQCFVDIEQDKQRYDRGEPIFYKCAAGFLPDDVYGEAALPPQFFTRQFGANFEMIGYEMDNPNKGLDQVTIALQKR